MLPREPIFEGSPGLAVSWAPPASSQARPSARTWSCTGSPGDFSLSTPDPPGEGGLFHPRQPDPPPCSDSSASPLSRLAVLVILSINLASHAWCLPPSPAWAPETQPLARPAQLLLRAGENFHGGCVRATGGGRLSNTPGLYAPVSSPQACFSLCLSLCLCVCSLPRPHRTQHGSPTPGPPGHVGSAGLVRVASSAPRLHLAARCSDPALWLPFHSVQGPALYSACPAH